MWHTWCSDPELPALGGEDPRCGSLVKSFSSIRRWLEGGKSAMAARRSSRGKGRHRYFVCFLYRPVEAVSPNNITQYVLCTQQVHNSFIKEDD